MSDGEDHARRRPRRAHPEGASEGEEDPSREALHYGVLEARPEPDGGAGPGEAAPVRRSADGTHFHYLLEFCHTHPGSHEPKDPHWRQEYVTDWRPGEAPALKDLPAGFQRFLDGRVRYGVKVGLDNIRALLHALDLEHGLPPVFLVGGTNGKGTVAAMLGEALSFAGYRPGVYTSPHVERFLERIQVSGADPDDAVLESACTTVQQTTEALDETGVHATYFEVATALSLVVFRAHRAAPLVMEVGMGGRGDAVNALTPVASIITNVGNDHAEHLGTELADRVREKAGILRPGVPCFTTAQGEALRHLETAAIEMGAPLVAVLPEAPIVHPEEASLALVRAVLAHPHVRRHVPRVRDLDPTSVRLPHLPGRQEVVHGPGGRSVLLDVAHNDESLTHLARTLDDWPVDPQRRILLVGLLRDKSVGAVAALARDRFHEVWVATPEGDRARAAESVADELRAAGVSGVHVGGAPDAAWKDVWARTPEAGLVVVTGSFYLVGPVRPHVRRAVRGA